MYGFYAVNEELVTTTETYVFRTEAAPTVDLRTDCNQDHRNFDILIKKHLIQEPVQIADIHIHKGIKPEQVAVEPVSYTHLTP